MPCAEVILQTVSWLAVVCDEPELAASMQYGMSIVWCYLLQCS